MSHLEQLISRYLDGELPPAQIEEFHRLLEESPEAELLLRRMTAVSHAARRTPELHQPSKTLQMRVLTALESEGLHTTHSAVADHAPTEPSPARSTTPRLRRTVLAAALLLLLIIGGSQWTNSPETSAPTIAYQRVRQEANARIDRVRTDAGTTVSIPSIILKTEPIASAAAGTTASHDLAASSERTLPTEQSDDSRLEAITAADSNVQAIPESVPHAMAEFGIRSREISSTIEDDSKLMAPERASGHTNASFSVSAASGITYIDRASVGVANEIDLKLSASLGSGHELAVVVGRSPSIEEIHRNHIDTRSRIFSNQDGGTRAVADASERNATMLPDYEVDLRNELWMGVAYNYGVQLSEQVRMAPGVKVGGGPAFWRVGIELPARYSITRSMAVEFVASATQTIPQDQSSKEFVNNSLGSPFVYFGHTAATTFTSVGMQIGLRVDLR